MAPPNKPKPQKAKGSTSHLSPGDPYAGQPPRLVVAINFAPLGPARDGATTQATARDGSAEKASYAQPLLTPDGVPAANAVLKWIAGTLEKHPVSEAWASKLWDKAIFDPLESTDDEKWARAFSEKFLGLAYFGPDILADFSSLHEHSQHPILFVYQRVQAKTSAWKVVNDKWGRPKLGLDLGAAEEANDDPAYSLGVACQHLTTYGVLTRGFSVEKDMNAAGLPASEKAGSLTIFKGNDGWFGTERRKPTKTEDLNAEEKKQADLASKGTFEDTKMTDDAVTKCTPKLAPGSIFTFNPYFDQRTGTIRKSKTVWVTAEKQDSLVKAQAELAALKEKVKASKGKMNKEELAAAAKLEAKLNSEIERDTYERAERDKKDVGGADGKAHMTHSEKDLIDDSNQSLTPKAIAHNQAIIEDKQQVETYNAGLQKQVTIDLRAQAPGSHITLCLRVWPGSDKKNVMQLFDTSSLQGGFNQAMPDDGTPHLHHLVQPCSFGGIYDGERKNQIYELEKYVGMGVPPSPADAASALKTLGEARPVGLMRLVLTTADRTNAKEKWKSGEVNENNILYVSPVMRMWHGTDKSKNFSPANLLWALRNTPYYRSVQAFVIAYSPRGELAEAMWERGARGKTVKALVDDATARRKKRIAQYGPAKVKEFRLAVPYNLFPVGLYSHDAAGYAQILWRAHTLRKSGDGTLPPGFRKAFFDPIEPKKTPSPFEAARIDPMLSFTHKGISPDGDPVKGIQLPAYLQSLV